MAGYYRPAYKIIKVYFTVHLFCFILCFAAAPGIARHHAFSYRDSFPDNLRFSRHANTSRIAQITQKSTGNR